MGAGRLSADAGTFDRDDDPPRPVDILRESDTTRRLERSVHVTVASDVKVNIQQDGRVSVYRGSVI